MIRISLDVERCKACGYCEYFCPKKCIKFGSYINKAGYKTVVVDEENCIKCGTCYTVCPDNVFSLIESEEKT